VENVQNTVYCLKNGVQDVASQRVHVSVHDKQRTEVFFVIKKSVPFLLGILIEATKAMAYHGTGRGRPSVFGGPKLPGWSLLVILAVFCFLAYLGWRWWKKVNEPAFRK